MKAVFRNHYSTIMKRIELRRFLSGLACAFERETTRARRETFNGSLTDWSVLRNVYRHDLNKHLTFEAVAIPTQLEILRGSHHSNASLNVILLFFEKLFGTLD